MIIYGDMWSNLTHSGAPSHITHSHVTDSRLAQSRTHARTLNQPFEGYYSVERVTELCFAAAYYDTLAFVYDQVMKSTIVLSGYRSFGVIGTCTDESRDAHMPVPGDMWHRLSPSPTPARTLCRRFEGYIC